MIRRDHRLWFSLFCLINCVIGMHSAWGAVGLSIHSINFAANASIPAVYTCSGDNKSPALAWTGVPVTAKTLAIVVRDPDAPRGSYVHWVLYNLPANVSALPEAVPTTPTIVEGAEQGVNGSGKTGYQGPCPPPGPTHHYHFTLFALDSKLDLPPGATAVEVEQAMTGHVVASAEVIGTFAR
jgi:Raf kinase inhibitor-like YbhB/YbcL family protein